MKNLARITILGGIKNPDIQGEVVLIGWKCKIGLIWKTEVLYWIWMIWEPSYIHEVRGHIPKLKVIWGQGEVVK